MRLAARREDILKPVVAPLSVDVAAITVQDSCIPALGRLHIEACKARTGRAAAFQHHPRGDGALERSKRRLGDHLYDLIMVDFMHGTVALAYFVCACLVIAQRADDSES
jgi:hypothetical protein